MPSTNASAAALGDMRRRVFGGSVLAFTAIIGLRVAVDVYSGPSIALGFAIGAFTAVTLWQAFMRLPDTARSVLCYVFSFLLM